MVGQGHAALDGGTQVSNPFPTTRTCLEQMLPEGPGRRAVCPEVSPSAGAWSPREGHCVAAGAASLL